MTVSISNMSQVWLSNTNTYNAIAMSVSTMGGGASANSSLLVLNVDGDQKFRVDAVGRLRMPYKPMFLGYPTTQYSGGGMPTQIMAVTATYNNGNCFNSGTNRFTAPITGWYRTTWGGLQLPATVTSLYVNGASVHNGNHFPATTAYISMTQTTIRYLNSGDYMQIYQWNGGGYYNDWWIWSVDHIA